MQPLYLVVQEEIGLEGLDGITLDGDYAEMQQVGRISDNSSFQHYGSGFRSD